MFGASGQPFSRGKLAGIRTTRTGVRGEAMLGTRAWTTLGFSAMGNRRHPGPRLPGETSGFPGHPGRRVGASARPQLACPPMPRPREGLGGKGDPRPAWRAHPQGLWSDRGSAELQGRPRPCVDVASVVTAQSKATSQQPFPEHLLCAGTSAVATQPCWGLRARDRGPAYGEWVVSCRAGLCPGENKPG